jgi:hypothetical protein
MPQPGPPNQGPITAQAINWAHAAGFSGVPLVTIVCIAQAESGLNIAAQHTNTGTACGKTGSVDRGILQINNACHPEVTDAAAYAGDSAFRAAWVISNHGTSFTPWATYNSGIWAATASATAQYAGVTLTPDILAKEKAAQSKNLQNIPVVGTPLAIIDATVQAAQATADIASFFTSIGAFFASGGWIRVGKIIAGGFMVATALTLLVKALATPAIANIASTVGAAIPGVGGAVARVAGASLKHKKPVQPKEEKTEVTA